MAEQESSGYEAAKEKVRASGKTPIAIRSHGGIVCKPASAPEYTRYNDGLNKAVNKGSGTVYDANRRLVLACLVYPDTEVARGIFEDAPLIVDKLADGILKASGGEEELEGN